jgi:hypothetical protein
MGEQGWFHRKKERVWGERGSRQGIGPLGHVPVAAGYYLPETLIDGYISYIFNYFLKSGGDTVLFHIMMVIQWPVSKPTVKIPGIG